MLLPSGSLPDAMKWRAGGLPSQWCATVRVLCTVVLAVGCGWQERRKLQVQRCLTQGKKLKDLQERLDKVRCGVEGSESMHVSCHAARVDNDNEEKRDNDRVRVRLGAFKELSRSSHMRCVWST